MTVIFLSNYFGHHTKPLSDALYRLTCGNYFFVGSERMTEERIALGWGNIEQPKYIRYLELSDYKSVEYWKDRIADADIVIIGSCPGYMLSKRRRTNKFTFYYSERLFKQGINHLEVLKWKLKDFLLLRRPTAHTYMLAASAYTPYDFSLLGYFKNKTYRWGYFPECKQYNIEEIFSIKDKYRNDTKVRATILWAARFIDWKHPEYPVKVAERLKKNGYSFRLEMIGCGVLEDQIKADIQKKDLQNCVTLLGSMTPEKVRKRMEESDIFLFTSDRNEGWGAVLNESMNSACAVVACKDIGSVPFLMENGENGLYYHYDDIDELYSKVKYLIDNPHERKRLGLSAYSTIVESWNAETAANNLLQLYRNLQEGKDTTISSGPCSKAPIIIN